MQTRLQRNGAADKQHHGQRWMRPSCGQLKMDARRFKFAGIFGPAYQLLHHVRVVRAGGRWAAMERGERRGERGEGKVKSESWVACIFIRW